MRREDSLVLWAESEFQNTFLADLRRLIWTFGCKELGGNLFGQLLAHDRHFGGSVNPYPHAATGDLQYRHGNFLANENALTNFSGYNQHVAIS